MSEMGPEGSVGTKVCPSCAEPVRAAAKVCRYCGYQFESMAPAVTARSAAAASVPTASRGGAIMSTVAGALLIAGSFLPWASVHILAHTIRRSGMGWRAGVFTLILGILALVVGIAGLAKLRLPTFAGIGTIAVGVVSAVIGIFEFARISTRLDTLRHLVERFGAQRLADRFATGHVGIGLWGVIAGSVLAIVGGFILLNAADDTAPPAAVPSPDIEQRSPVSV
jgi:hypothetical protein